MSRTGNVIMLGLLFVTQAFLRYGIGASFDKQEQHGGKGNKTISIFTLSYRNNLLTVRSKNECDTQDLHQLLKRKPRSTGIRKYIWNKTLSTIEDYHFGFCSFVCEGEVKRDLALLPCRNLECFECTCDKPRCRIYGTCCPDLIHNLMTNDYFPLSDETPKSHSTTNSAAVDSLNTLSKGSYPPLSSADSSFRANRTRHVPTALPRGVQPPLRSNPFKGLRKISRISLTSEIKMPLTNKSEIWMALPSTSHTDKLFCYKYSNYESPALIVRGCPESYDDRRVISLCEAKAADLEVSRATLAHIFDPTTNATFYNSYCARCHNATRLVQWNLTVPCQHYLHVYTATDEDEFLNLASRPESRCRVSQTPADPKNHYVLQCSPDWYYQVIRTCNVTGKWKDFDEDVVTACLALKDPIYKVQIRSEGSSNVFKNIFCAICNADELPEFRTSCRRRFPAASIWIDEFNPPFSLLLGLNNRYDPMGKESLGGNCSELEWLSPDGTCVPHRCSPGKTIMGSVCSTALPAIRGLGYRARLWLIPEYSTNVSSYGDAGGSFKTVFSSVLGRLMPQVLNIITLHFKMHILHFTIGVTENRISLPHTGEAPTKSTLTSPRILFWIDLEGIAHFSTPRDVFESQMIENLFVKSLNATQGNESKFRAIPMNVELDSRTLCNSSEDKFCLTRNLNEYRITKKMTPYTDDRKLFLNVSLAMTCRFVRFNNSFFEISEHEKYDTLFRIYKITLKFRHSRSIIQEPHHLQLVFLEESGELSVCAELLDHLTWEIPSPPWTTLAKYILTLVCVSVSLVCLLLTVITYSSFPTLRSVAGKNNMCLCISLILAQTSLLVSSHVRRPRTLCVVVGILTHFLWLTMFSWSFACCLHMFKVFTSTTRVSALSQKRQLVHLIKTVLFCFSVPTLIVASVVLVSYITSKGQSIGYGQVCYLNSSLLVGLTMILPLAVVLVCNLVFFLVTILKIRSVRKLQQTENFKKSDKHNLYVYVKLSSLTGAFWLVAIVAEATANDPLIFISIILNGLQGVFIFFSYICNKRVLQLYRQRLRLGAESSTSQLTGRSTLAQEASDVRRAQETMSSAAEGWDKQLNQESTDEAGKFQE
ncbi:uncharacterized protein LOC101852596 [Aplysia californica]|uniref:Uncharacterized protein LOC101852596 n=1 Tax=Aplysia californica TaxID=6500 RepID=A0ABM1W4W4_APLCA|nr:uncharacterized protein LOC101852596 [Aplysia californica]